MRNSNLIKNLQINDSRLKDIENFKNNPREFFKQCKAIKNGFAQPLNLKQIRMTLK